jgi:hypothetical protein
METMDAIIFEYTLNPFDFFDPLNLKKLMPTQKIWATIKNDTTPNNCTAKSAVYAPVKPILLKMTEEFVTVLNEGSNLLYVRIDRNRKDANIILRTPNSRSIAFLG